MKTGPILSLCAAQIRHSFPATLNAAKSASKFLCQKFPNSNVLRKAHHFIRNWYEGGWPVWTDGSFSYLSSLVQDARWDQNYVTRREMMRRMRYWAQNSPVMKAILSVGKRYTVGASGLHVSFYPDDMPSNGNTNSDSQDWCERADKVVEEWFQNCGWNGETMAELLGIGYECQRIDGEIFVVKTRKSMPLAFDGRVIPNVLKPALQLVEAHRVESPWNRFDDKGIVDGVQYEPVKTKTGTVTRELSRRVGYYVRNGQSSWYDYNDSWSLINDEDCWQIRNQQRANQPRAVSDFHACAIRLNKFEDLLDIEMKAAASQAVRAVGVESASGQAQNPMDRRLGAFLNRGVTSAPPSPNPTLTPEDGRYTLWRRETGAYVYGLKTGEKIHFDSPTRPSESTLNLFELFINEIVAASQIPRCLTIDLISGSSAKPQGTEVRAKLDSADSFFKADFQKWKNFVRESVIWFMEWAIEMDERVADPPPNWRDLIHIQQPEACNVDVGYTTTAMLMMLAAGCADYEMILGPQGISCWTVFKRLKRQQAFLEDNEIKVTLPALMPGQIPLDGKNKPEEATA